MDVEPYIATINQPALLEFGEPGWPDAEELPALWLASNALTSPDVEEREAGLQKLVALNAVKRYWLIAYLVASRIVEPDLRLRSEVVRQLGDVFSPDTPSNPTSDQVRSRLYNFLSQMRTRQIFSLLQVVEYDPKAENPVTRILQKCSFAGNHLSEILLDRHVPLSIRKIAVEFIGKIGYLEAASTIERLASRLESRLNGQMSLIDMPINDKDEVSLLPLIQITLEKLRAP